MLDAIQWMACTVFFVAHAAQIQKRSTPLLFRITSCSPSIYSIYSFPSRSISLTVSCIQQHRSVWCALLVLSIQWANTRKRMKKYKSKIELLGPFSHIQNKGLDKLCTRRYLRVKKRSTDVEPRRTNHEISYRKWFSIWPVGPSALEALQEIIEIQNSNSVSSILL